MTDRDAAHVVQDQSAVFAWLADPATHGAPVRRIDTHGAVVVLAGERALKAKRAVRFPFLDYSTLERRKAACEAEVAVNAPLAPGIYRGTVPVVRRPDGSLALGGEGEPVEWLVAMARFDEDATLDKVVERNGLSPALLARLAEAVVTAHASAPRREAAGAVASLGAWIAQNGAAFSESPDLFPPDEAARLCAASAAALEQVTPLLLERGAMGRVRRGHGDLHLRNLVLIDGRPIPFDAIEFDEAVATGDVLYDLAFLLMDLMERGHEAEACGLLNRYLWASDPCDVAGLAALPLFLSLRAVIRAKVVAAGVASLPEAQRADAQAEARRYFDLAHRVLRDHPACLVAVGGYSGTGKSTLAAGLAPALGRLPGAVHLRTDIVRKRLGGVADTHRLPAPAYTAQASARVYETVRSQAAAALRAGFAVVVDAVHAREAERVAIAAVAADAAVPFAGLWLTAPATVLVARVEARTGDASDADAAVVRGQLERPADPVSWATIAAAGPPGDVLRSALATLGPAFARQEP
jgi:uncharacterized protein